MADNPSTTRPPQRLERDAKSEKRSLELFLAQNPGTNITSNPVDRARAEEFINVNTYGTSRPVFESDFNITQLEKKLGERDPAAFLTKIAQLAEAKRPTGQAKAGILASLQKIEDPRIRNRLLRSAMGVRGQATQALLGRAENIFGQQTEALQGQLASARQGFQNALAQAAAAEQARLEKQAADLEFQRQIQLMQLQAGLSGGGSSGGGGGGGGGGGYSSSGDNMFSTELTPEEQARVDAENAAAAEAEQAGPSGPGYLTEAGLRAFGPSVRNATPAQLFGQLVTGKPLVRELKRGIGGALNFLTTPINAQADGGPVQPGQPTLVGERGPELIVPTQPGQVVPNEVLNPPSTPTLDKLLPPLEGIRRAATGEPAPVQVPALPAPVPQQAAAPPIPAAPAPVDLAGVLGAQGQVPPEPAAQSLGTLIQPAQAPQGLTQEEKDLLELAESNL